MLTVIGGAYRAGRVTKGQRAIGYLRVSTSGQAERGMGLEVQRDAVHKFAATKGFELVDVVQEAASGAVKNGEVFSYDHRPVLLSLRERAQRREYDFLVVAKYDRLSRDQTSLVVFERHLQKHGVTVLSVAEENGDGPIAKFIRGQLALVAELERDMILERVGAGKAKKKQLGRHVHGRVAYGYRSKDGVFKIDESASAVVRRIFDAAKEGDTPGRIARGLNHDGIPSPYGKAWTKGTVRGILTNPVYTGERYGVKRAHPAIVSRRAFNVVQTELSRRSRAGA